MIVPQGFPLVIAPSLLEYALRSATAAILGNSDVDIIEQIRSTVETHPIVLFMKGTPQFPMCGFSSRTSAALREVGAQYHSVNILENPEIRANLPRFSNWPTFPQLFINGELIGGCDITMELYEKGELAQMVSEAQKT